MIEIALTLCGEGAHTAAPRGIQKDRSHMTIALIVAWLTVAMIYLMAGTDRRKRYY